MKRGAFAPLKKHPAFWGIVKGMGWGYYGGRRRGYENINTRQFSEGGQHE
jgi:hypothetical protein